LAYINSIKSLESEVKQVIFKRTAKGVELTNFIMPIKKVDYYENIRAFELLDDRFSVELGWISDISHPVSELAKEYVEMIEKLQKLN